MKKLFLGCLVVTLLTLSTCSDNPITDDFVPPGSRNIEWSSDTLKIQQGWLFLVRIWGDTPENVWAICYGGNVSNLIWKYDGLKWVTDSIARDISPSSLFGFNRNNIWIGNINSTIWHFNGSTWQLSKTLSLVGYDRIGFNDIWGEYSNNIYAVGAADQFNGTDYTGIIAHYTAGEWKLINTTYSRISFIQIRKQVSTGLYYILGVNFESTGIVNKLFTFNGKQLKEVFQEYQVDFISEIDGEVYFVIGKKIYKINGDSLELWKDFTTTKFVGFIWGRNEKDFYCKNYDGVGHYNGSDLQTVFETNLSINGATILENNVFLITEDIDNNLEVILRGKIINK